MIRRACAVGVLAVLLAGCGGAEGAGGISGQWVDAPDGKVWCAASGAGGTDCDWDTYHQSRGHQ